MKNGIKIKLVKENICNDVFLEMIEDNPKLLEDELTVEWFNKVDEEDGKEYFDVRVKELPCFDIFCNEYVICK